MHKQNNETYQCAIVNGVGGFLNHPDITTDIIETAAAYPTQDNEMFASCNVIQAPKVPSKLLSLPPGAKTF